jgi:hypothetical protein
LVTTSLTCPTGALFVDSVKPPSRASTVLTGPWQRTTGGESCRDDCRSGENGGHSPAHDQPGRSWTRSGTFRGGPEPEKWLGWMGHEVSSKRHRRSLMESRRRQAGRRGRTSAARRVGRLPPSRGCFIAALGVKAVCAQTAIGTVKRRKRRADEGRFARLRCDACDLSGRLSARVAPSPSHRSAGLPDSCRAFIMFIRSCRERGCGTRGGRG